VSRLNVLSFSSCFPSSDDPTRGVFVLQRLAALKEFCNLEIVHPWPWFPGYRSRDFVRPRRAREEIQGLNVHHPRFFYLPGILKHLDSWFYERSAAKWLDSYCAGSRPDLLDVHFVWPDGVAMARVAARLGLPLAITLRGKINPRVGNPKMRSQIAEALQSADAVISVSDAMANLAAELGAPRSRIAVIPNGVNTELFKPRSAGDARRELSLPADGRYIVAVAFIQPSKGFGELVEALSRLPEDVHLVVVGEAFGGEAYLSRLRRRASKLGCADRLLFAGPQSHERVPLYFNAADVSVLASHAEGCPNVVIESLACGTPVVATAVGGVPDTIRNGENGFLVPPQDTEALARALADALARDWSRAGVRSSVDGRSWTSVAKRVLTVFEKIAGNRATVSASDGLGAARVSKRPA